MGREFGYSFDSFRVLTITTSEARLQHMREAVTKFSFNPEHAKRFLWGTTEGKAIPALLFEPIWCSMDTQDQTIYRIG